jgi:histidinol phosphatase-like PHP family hydrolase/predicted nuclease with RNAse H fold/dephospho-CoA kinase
MTTAATVAEGLPADYLRPRDFEYVQPLYDLAFLIQVDALAKRRPVAEYRSLALWKSAIRLDGYSTNLDAWLKSPDSPNQLDFKPSPRIREHLLQIEETGSLAELKELTTTSHQACLRLRGIRGLGLKQIAAALAEERLSDSWFARSAGLSAVDRGLLLATWEGTARGHWQSAHVVPPLLRILSALEAELGRDCGWALPDVADAFEPIQSPLHVTAFLRDPASLGQAARKVAGQDRFFRAERTTPELAVLEHGLGWRAEITARIVTEGSRLGKPVYTLARELDVLLPNVQTSLQGDLHSHTNWSDGATPLTAMVQAVQDRDLGYLAITDHSRSSKLQGGLTPVAWLRQAVSLSLLSTRTRILHGIELDILDDGRLDLPASLLAGMDIVVASVHTSWSPDRASNTTRLIRAIESGGVDILGHPTSTILGKPGAPTYYRAPAPVDWSRVFHACREWSVAIEFNCFPSRLDPALPLLKQACEAGCWVAFGSDAHSRAHLDHLRAGERIAQRLEASGVLNRLRREEVQAWVSEARRRRSTTKPRPSPPVQGALFSCEASPNRPSRITVRVARREKVPGGSRIVGLDLTASKAKLTGAAVLDQLEVRTASLATDEDILAFVRDARPAIVSIDSPLGLPGGVSDADTAPGIMREAEYDLASVGIPAYPALIDSMKPLTLRGMRLRADIEALADAPRVIESYPGAAQDILCIPRKQKGLALLRSGLADLGLRGSGLATRSHDEMDAVTAAVVGRFFEAGRFESMGVPAEAQLIVPTIRPLRFSRLPVLCLAGRTGAGKSVVARYLALFYGFRWLRTRAVIRDLLLDDLERPPEQRILQRRVDRDNIRESDLTEFGILVLERYKQEPLLQKLRDTVAGVQAPVVVDAARDLPDIGSLAGLGRELLVWFVDAPHSAIEARLAQRRRLTPPSQSAVRKIDQKMSSLKGMAHYVLQNDASLEDLRWRVDDGLFGVFRLNGRA